MTAKWCQHCRKHIAVESRKAIAQVCPECGQPTSLLPMNAVGDSLPDFSLGEDSAMPPASSRLRVGEFSFDSWEIDQDLLDAERAIALQQRDGQKRIEQAAEQKYQQQAARDAAKKRPPAHLRHDFNTIQAMAAGFPSEYAPLAMPQVEQPRSDTFLAWTARAIGWTLLAFGLVLLACAWVSQRGDLNNLGWPIAVVGLIGIVLGRMLRPSRKVVSPPVMQGVPQPYGPWGAQGFLAQNFFPPTYVGGIPTPHASPSGGEAVESREMLREMKSQIEKLTARLDQPNSGTPRRTAG